MKRIAQTLEASVIDSETGVIQKQYANRVYTWGSEPEYIKLYLQDLMYFSDMPKQYANTISSLLKRISFAGDEDGLCVILTPRIKKSIAKELGWKRTSSLDNALCDLVKGKIIERIDRGMYRFNPYFFGKGNWADISKLRLTIDYDEIKGKTFQTVCHYKNVDGQLTMDFAVGQ